jgi:hypothetical protein
MECGRDWEWEDAENERMTIEMRNDAYEVVRGSFGSDT